MSKITGNALLQDKRFIMDNYGQEEYERFLNLLSEETRKLLKGPILTGTMYDNKYEGEVMDTFHKTYGDDALKELAYFKALSQLKGFYGLVVRFLSIEKVLNKASQMFSKYFSEGEVIINQADKEYVKITIKHPDLSDGEKEFFLYYCQAIGEKVLQKKIRGKKVIKDDTTTELSYNVTAITKRI